MASSKSKYRIVPSLKKYSSCLCVVNPLTQLQHLATTNLIIYLYFFPECYINGIIYYIGFCINFFHLVLPLRSICIVSGLSN